MTVEEVKAALEDYRQIQKDIRRLEAEQEELHGIRVAFDSTFSVNSESICLWQEMNNVQKQIQREITVQIDSSKRRMQEVAALIDSVQNDDLKAILTCKYIQGLTFEQIAERLYCCLTTAMRKHKIAIEHLSKEMGLTNI